MTDLVLQSNRSSAILDGLAKAETQDLSYEIDPSMPLLAKQYNEIQSNTSAAGALNGQEVTFVLNKSNLLTNMLVRHSFTTTTTDEPVTSTPGLKILEWMELRTNNKTIARFSDSAIIAYVSDQPEGRQSSMTRRALPLALVTEVNDSVTTTSGAITYTPVPSSFFDAIKNALDLNFYEAISLVCHYSTPAKANFTATTVTMVSSSLWVWGYRLDDGAYDVLRAKNQSPSRPLNMLTYSSFKESLVCTGTTTNTINIRNNYAAFKTFIMLKPIKAAGADVKINSFDFSVGGVLLTQSAPGLVGSYEQEMLGASSLRSTSATALARYDAKPICVNWGMEPQNWVSNSGALSFSNVNNSSVTIYHPAITAADFNIEVVHFYWNILTLSGANGSMDITLSS